MEMRCYRHLLHISYKDHITNEIVCTKYKQFLKIQLSLRRYITTVKKRKLRWFGHMIRSSGLCKKIVQDTVPGKRKRGRQKKRWEDNIREWTGLDFNSSQRAAEDPEDCRRCQQWCPYGPDGSGTHVTGIPNIGLYLKGSYTSSIR